MEYQNILCYLISLFLCLQKDRINFEHIVSIEEEGTENGYMADLGNTDFEYLKRYENNIVIVSHYEKQNNWALVKIENNSNLKDRQKFIYEVLSNKRELGFTGRFASVKSLVIRTKGEIARLMQCYENSKRFDFYRCGNIGTLLQNTTNNRLQPFYR